MYDCSTMIKLILEIINPETKGNVRELKDKIKWVKIEDFSRDTIKMLAYMQLIYE